MILASQAATIGARCYAGVKRNGRGLVPKKDSIRFTILTKTLIIDPIGHRGGSSDRIIAIRLAIAAGNRGLCVL
jgi:hypothetical protein